MLWGPGEQAVAESVAAASNGAAAVSPSTSIGQLFELTRAAAVMVSGDTGPMHIAGAMGTPVILQRSKGPLGGMPAAVDSFRIARETFKELGK